MTRFTRSCSAAFAALLLVYLGVAFVTWEFDPSQWHEATRFVMLLVAAPFATCAAVGEWG